MPTTRHTALLLIGLSSMIGTAMSGGCASSFRYDSDEAPPPPAQLAPTTAPSRSAADLSTTSGVLRQVFVNLPVRLWEYMQGDTPSARALELEDSKLPDRRRRGINELADYDFGKKPPYTTRYGQIARFDADPSVRATAIRALNLSRDGSATGIFIAALVDDSPAVRLEACKALANVPDPAAVTGLLKVFQNTTENIDIRIAAADALRQYRQLEVARALINVLTDREFGLSWQARQSLRTMTGADERYDQAAWLQRVTTGDTAIG